MYYFNAIRERRDLKESEIKSIKLEAAQKTNEIQELGLKNIFWCKVRKCYVVQSFSNGKCIDLGTYDDLVDAELAYLAEIA